VKLNKRFSNQSLFYSLLIFLSVGVFFSNLALAQETQEAQEAAKGEAPKVGAKEEEPENKEVIQPGVIASFGKIKGSGSVGVSSTGEAGGGANSPIAASIRPSTKGSCEAVVRNTSATNSYSIRFSISGQTSTGGSVGRRSFSARLKPGGSTTKTVRCPQGAGMKVVLKSGKKVS